MVSRERCVDINGKVMSIEAEKDINAQQGPMTDVLDQDVCGQSHRVSACGRVLIYGINYSPEPIGVGKYTGELGDYLSAEGYHVDVITAVPHYPGWIVRSGYRNRFSVEYKLRSRIIRCPLLLRSKMHGVWRLFAPLSFAISSAPVAVWTILTKRPDTILCVEPTLLSAPLALVLSRFVGARTVLHIQDLEIDAAFAVGHFKSRVMAKWTGIVESFFLKSFDAIVTISNGMRQKIIQKGVAANRVFLIRNWVNLDDISPWIGDNQFRRKLKISNEKFVVLYSGNIGAKQGLDVLLDAASRLVDRRDLIFVVAGEGPAKAKIVSRYGHLPNVRFLELQPAQKLREFLGFADLHVIPQEAGVAELVLPSKLGPILASGRPVIVTADKGSELYEFSSGAGYVVPAGDSVALADAISRISKLPVEELAALGDQGCSRAAGLSAKAVLPDFVSVLHVRSTAP